LEERDIVVVSHRRPPDFGICMASKSGTVASNPGLLAIEASTRASTTDGIRLIFSVSNGASEDVFAVGARASYPFSAPRLSRFATLPPNNWKRSIEWHNDRLYAFGGCDQDEEPGNSEWHNDGIVFFDSFHVFNEETGLWEDLPPMPHACILAASGFIGDRLYVAGGFKGYGHGHGHGQLPGQAAVDASDLRALQVYDTATRTWSLGAPLPEGMVLSRGLRRGKISVVVDGRLILMDMNSTLVYDP